MKRLDLAGKRFGRWTAKEFIREDGKTMWRCLCDCGNEARVGLSNLVSGKSQSCGCLHKESNAARALDLAGQRFGSLLVMERSEERSANKKIVWHCKCDCGNESFVQTNNLRSGNSRSCNASVHWTIPDGDARLYRSNFTRYEQRAKQSGFSFDLTLSSFAELIKQPCFYCGHSGTNKPIKTGSKVKREKVNGIDRIDSSKGYEEGNMQPCCSVCNLMKRHHSHEEFLAHIKKIIDRFS